MYNKNTINLITKLNIKKIAIGLVMIEILDKTTEIMDKSEILYRLIQKSLIALNNTQINKMLLLLFYKIQFSKYSGFNPVPEFCHDCNNKLENTYYIVQQFVMSVI